MLYKPDVKVIEAFRNLEGNPNFMTILEWFQSGLDRTDHEGRSAVEEYRIRWNQGGTQVLEKVFEARGIAKVAKR
jgi:hypothetical protein